MPHNSCRNLGPGCKCHQLNDIRHHADYVLGRLKAQVTGMREIDGASSLEAAMRGAVATPSLYLIPLTETGREVQPAIRELIRWGGRFLFPPVPGDTFEPDWVLLGLDAIARRTPVPEMNVGLVVTHGKKSAGFTVAGSRSGTAIRKGIADCRGTLEAPFDAVLQIIGMGVPLQDAITARRATVTGSMAVVRKLPSLFDLADRPRLPAATG